MTQPQEDKKPFKPAVPGADDQGKFVPSYQTNKVPWQVHLMWGIFTLAAIIYMVRLAIPDFIRWW